ncbi:helix-turn-helix domain-containing protein [Candidatus Williamhamiltonella defendens]|uniref:Repressor n=2 Tax=Candidatus Williamhamiltonella defendens TaxID=138072 RepID=A0A249DY44_9ENTR|nr:helix-turn-helix domain-containing protein [Candidatus Hamiltonella defensa]ASX26000.1 repressor [Candidatus Hamiltonella defensa (Bemisia tabaci)]CED79565.1 Phage repressor protein CI [Candidatus Hamiltonella defensa (Bemisia tabaci)]
MKSTLAQRLNFAMQSRNFSQGALARASRVSQPTIFKLTKGTSKGSKKIVDIAHALKVNPDWLARGVGEMEGESISSFISPSDLSNEVPVWNKEGKTEDIVNLPEGKSVSTWRAYILDRNSGCKEAPVGSIVIVDTAIKPGASDLVVAMISDMISVYRFLPSNGPGLLSVDDKRVPLFDLSESGELIGVAVFLFRDLRR